MTDLNKKRETIFSEPVITIAAKDFLQDPNKSSNYIKAVDLTVSAAVAATEMKIRQIVQASYQGKSQQ